MSAITPPKVTKLAVGNNGWNLYFVLKEIFLQRNITEGSDGMGPIAVEGVIGGRVLSE